MAGKTETYYPPYEGREPYIHLCFSDRDQRKARPLLRRLLLRGCRVWYCLGEAPDRSAQQTRDERMLGAGLTVLFLTQAARQDTELKNRLLVCQRDGQPILVLDTDGGDRGLSIGLTKAEFTTVLGGGAGDAFDAILHGRGFSQIYLGPPLPVNDHKLWLGRVRTVLLILTALLAVGAGVRLYLYPPEALSGREAAEPEDEVTIEDEALRRALRAAVGGGPLTEENLSGIETLSLSRLPEREDDLEKLPNLTTLILSQEAARTAPAHPALYESYTLIVAGGNEP